MKKSQIIGCLIFILFISITIYWEYVGRKTFTTTEVIALKHGVVKGHEIQLSDLEVISINKDRVVDAILDEEKIIGLQAAHYIPGGVQIVPEYFQKLVPNAEEVIMQIPNAWIISYPDSIRKNDLIKIVFKKEKKDKKVDSENKTENLEYSEIKKDIYAHIIFIKDSQGNEVLDTTSIDRENVSAKIQALEVVINRDDLEEMKKIINEDFKVIITY